MPARFAEPPDEARADHDSLSGPAVLSTRWRFSLLQFSRNPFLSLRESHAEKDSRIIPHVHMPTLEWLAAPAPWLDDRAFRPALPKKATGRAETLARNATLQGVRRRLHRRIRTSAPRLTVSIEISAWWGWRGEGGLVGSRRILTGCVPGESRPRPRVTARVSGPAGSSQRFGLLTNACESAVMLSKAGSELVRTETEVV